MLTLIVSLGFITACEVGMVVFQVLSMKKLRGRRSPAPSPSSLPHTVVLIPCWEEPRPFRSLWRALSG